ncbi:MAG: hypothetical protein WA728_25985 [Xanthobacteraceae bacterium]
MFEQGKRYVPHPENEVLEGDVTYPWGIGAMDNDANGLAELDEVILIFDVQGDALERAAAASVGEAVTIGSLYSLVSMQLAPVMTAADLP